MDEINDLGGKLENSYGISLEQLKEVSRMGIAKINVDTDIRLAVTRNVRLLFSNNPSLRNDEYLKGVWELMEANPSAFDPRVYLAAVMDTVMYNFIPSESVQLFENAVKDGGMDGIRRLLVAFRLIGMARFVEARTFDEMKEFYKEEEK